MLKEPEAQAREVQLAVWEPANTGEGPCAAAPPRSRFRLQWIANACCETKFLREGPSEAGGGTDLCMSTAAVWQPIPDAKKSKLLSPCSNFDRVETEGVCVLQPFFGCLEVQQVL